MEDNREAQKIQQHGMRRRPCKILPVHLIGKASKKQLILECS
jgi:hypothetical protein